jgi:uncharacterized membrane protein
MNFKKHIIAILFAGLLLLTIFTLFWGIIYLLGIGILFNNIIYSANPDLQLEEVHKLITRGAKPTIEIIHLLILTVIFWIVAFISLFIFYLKIRRKIKNIEQNNFTEPRSSATHF